MLATDGAKHLFNCSVQPKISETAFGFAGAIVEHWTTDQTVSESSCGTGEIFLFAFETNGRNFESTVVFLKNSNVKLKYIFEYLC